MSLFQPGRARLSWGIIGVSIAIPLVLLAARADPSFSIARDTPGYVRPARALFQTGRYLASSSSSFPEMERTPIYPVVLGVSSLGGPLHPLRVVLLQALMRGLLVTLILTLPVGSTGRRVDWRIPAAAFVATDLLSAVMALQILTETLSSLLLVLTAWLYCWWRQQPSTARLLVVGLVAGITTLTRPINVAFLPVLFALAAFDVRARPRRSRTLALAVLVTASMLLPGAWVLRNYAWSGEFIFTTITSKNLLYYRAGGILAAERGQSLRDVRREFESEDAAMHDVATAPPWELDARRRAQAWPIILHAPVTAAWQALAGLGRALGGTGVELWNDWAAIGSQPRRLLALALAGATALHLLALYLWLIGSWRHVDWRHPPVLGAWCLAVFGALLLTAAGPESYSRFRVPVMPFLAMSAGIGWASRTTGGRGLLTHARPVPMRVVHVVTTMRVAGAERFGLDLAIAQRQAGVDASIVAMYSGGPLVDVARAAGVPHTVITRRGKYDLVAWVRLVSVLRRLDPDLVHVHDVAPIVRGVPAARLACSAPVVATRHDVRSVGRIREAVLKATGRFASALVASSRAVHEYLTRTGAGTNVPVIHCGIDLSRFQFREPRPTVTPRLVSVGRLEAVKGHDTLIDATARLAGEWPTVSLTIFGDGPLGPSLSARASALGIADRVRLAGVAPSPEDVLSEFDVFCFPSRFEAQGLALIEAQAVGVPVVASAVGGILEAVTHEETGLLVEPGNAEALADAIARLARDPRLRSTLARAAHERIGRWDVREAARAYLACYDDVLGLAADSSGASSPARVAGS